ncbi:MAG: IS701 family transposase, partial [Actinomycetota bacterium]|nr:IS701 family transposase [Actinomycetota bacterium]
MSVLEEDVVAASETALDDRLIRWQAGFDEMFGLVAGEFAQAQSRWRARWYLLGLLSGAERKNSWTIAEQAGDLSPDGMQRLLNHYVWDADAVRDHLQSYVLGHLADPVPGVVVADETGFLQKGVKSAGVQRQYSGTAGRIENCQIGVFLTYVSARGRALIDRELYLPKTWTDDRDRCAEAGIDDEVEFATKPVLARRMLERLIAAHGKQAVGWFTADEAYGDNPELRDWLEDRDINYVMVISCAQRFATPTGPRRADELARAAPKTGWQRLSAGTGSKGHRLYDWLLIDPGTDTINQTPDKPTTVAYEGGGSRGTDLLLAAARGAKACLPKDTLRCGGTFVPIAAGVAALVETAVDIKEVSDLDELVFRQLGQLLDPRVRGLPPRDAHQLRLPAVPGQDPKYSDQPGSNPHPRIRRLESEYHGVQRFIVGPQRAGNIAVVGGKGEGAGQPPVKPDLASVLLDLVFVPTAPRRLYHHIDQLHAQQDRHRFLLTTCDVKWARLFRPTSAPYHDAPKPRGEPVGLEYGILGLNWGLRCSMRSCCDVVLAGESAEDRSAAHLVV